MSYYGIDLSRFYPVNVNSQGELPVDNQYIYKIVHEEFDDGKIYKDVGIVEPTYYLLKKFFKEMKEMKILEEVVAKTIKFKNTLKKIKHNISSSKHVSSYRGSKERRIELSEKNNSRDKKGGEKMETKLERDELSRLRFQYLKTKLKILGFDSIEDLDYTTILDGSKGYRALGRIGSDLEHFINPERSDEESIRRYEEETEEEMLFIANQDEFLEKVRGIYPDFGLNMEQKVGTRDWIQYSRIIERTGLLLKDLIIGNSRKNLAKAPEIVQADVISDLIDSPEFATACRIEDEFMSREFERFRELARARGCEDETVRNTSCGVLLVELVRTSEAIASKKQKYIDSYAEYQRFLSKVSGKTLTIKPADGQERKRANGNSEGQGSQGKNTGEERS